MSSSSHSIILDWDRIGNSVMENRIKELFAYDWIESFEIRMSPSLDGYHIYINSFTFLNPTMRYRFRFENKDDFKRLAKDMINKSSRVREVSFVMKIKNGFEFKEIKMFKYYRNKFRDDWKCQKFQLENTKLTTMMNQKNVTM